MLKRVAVKKTARHMITYQPLFLPLWLVLVLPSNHELAKTAPPITRRDFLTVCQWQLVKPNRYAERREAVKHSISCYNCLIMWPSSAWFYPIFKLVNAWLWSSSGSMLRYCIRSFVVLNLPHLDYGHVTVYWLSLYFFIWLYSHPLLKNVYSINVNAEARSELKTLLSND